MFFHIESSSHLLMVFSHLHATVILVDASVPSRPAVDDPRHQAADPEARGTANATAARGSYSWMDPKAGGPLRDGPGII